MESFNNIFDMIEDIQTQSTTDEILTCFSGAAKEFGAEYFIITGLPMPGGRLEPLVMIEDWPEGWWNCYMENNYINDDPVGQHCYRSHMPFYWREAPPIKGKEKEGWNILNEAGDFDMKTGLSVPIHTEDGFQSCISFAAPKLQLSPSDKTMLHMLALYTHGRLRFVRGDKIKRKGALSPRQKEVITWVAAGKTSQDISEILNITKRTVTAHIQDAGHKLNAVNRTQLVVEAIRFGQIRI